MENEATTKTPIPTRSGFPLLSSVSCLLDSVSCLLSPAFCPTRPSCPACLPSTLVETPLQIALFFCKTKPISLSAEPMQPSLPQRIMKINHPCPTRKNKPNQTQFPRPARKNEPNRTQFSPPIFQNLPFRPGIYYVESASPNFPESGGG